MRFKRPRRIYLEVFWLLVSTVCSMHSNVYIRGVPTGFETEDLRYLFEVYGPIVSVKILEPRHSGDKRLGFVKFESMEHAWEAIHDMNHRVIAGQTLEVREAEFDVDPKKNILDKTVVENDNLFVRGFPSHWTPEQFSSYFSQAGVVVSVRILGCSMPLRGGVGLVRFQTVEEAREAIVQFHNAWVEGFGPLHVKYSTVKSKFRFCRAPIRKSLISNSLAERNRAALAKEMPWMESASHLEIENHPLETQTVAKALLVCNLPPTATELNLYREFARFGGITSINIGLDECQSCTGMAFVNFVDGSCADRAAKALHGSRFDGHLISVIAHL